ncbi:MAG: hypothetical protein RIR73_3032, partial [Chloroflexota bacterium]
VNSDQIAFTGAFEDAGFKIGWEDFGKEGKDLELHWGILAYKPYITIVWTLFAKPIFYDDWGMMKCCSFS